MYIVHCTSYSLRSFKRPMYTAQCTVMYGVHCTMYNVHVQCDHYVFISLAYIVCN